MTWWEWLLIGFVIWSLLCWVVCAANMRFWNLVDPDRELPGR